MVAGILVFTDHNALVWNALLALSLIALLAYSVDLVWARVSATRRRT